MIYIQQILKMISTDRFGRSVSGGGSFMFQKLILTLSLLFTTLCVFGQVKYVTPAGSGDGSSWEKAAGEGRLNEFMNTPSTTVWAAKGTYKLSVQSGIPGNHFTLAAGSKLYGGFVGTEVNLEERVVTDKWNFKNETILSQDQVTKASNSRVLYMNNGSGTSALTIIDGVTLSGGVISDIENGGGISTSPDANYISIENCKILNNQATGPGSNARTARGAGVYLTGGKLINSLIKGNTSNKGGFSNGYGGGVCIAGADITVQGCEISENKVIAGNDGGDNSNGTTGGVGGGICVYAGSVNARIIDCLIKANNANVGTLNSGASGYGAGVYLQAPTLVENCKIEGNTITGAGGGGGGSLGAGISVQSPSTINNCTISLNTTVRDCGGLHLYGNAANTVVTNCIIASNKGAQHAGGGAFIHVPATFINCLFANNQSTNGGAYNSALAVESKGSASVTNCTFANNKADNGGGAGGATGISIFSWGSTMVKNTIFVGGESAGTKREVTTWGSGAVTLENCALENDAYALHNNGNGTLTKTNCIVTLKTDGFVNPIAIKGYSADWSKADWNLKSSSECIGSGTPSGSPSKDILGKDRAAIPCIGAYEFQVPQNFYVRTSASGLGDGSSWENAAGGAAGIDSGLAKLSQNIYVAEGTYVSTNTMSEDKKGGFEIPAGVAIYGGFPDGGGEMNSRDSTKTILNPFKYGDNVGGRVVTVLGANVRLDGLTISGGVAGGTSGGGIAVHGANFKMNDCRVLSNSSDGGAAASGGGLYINAPNAVVQNSLFTGNTKTGSAGNGGGAIYISNVGTTALIEYCTISENTSSLNGGGLFIGGASATVRNCRLFLNTASGGNGGGAIYLDANGALIQNCLVYHNHTVSGGAGFMGTNKDAKIVNSLFVRNSSSSANKMNVSGDTGNNTGTSTQFINSIAIQGYRDGRFSSNLSSVTAINSIYPPSSNDYGTAATGCKKITEAQNNELNHLNFVKPVRFANKGNNDLTPDDILEVKAADYRLTSNSDTCIDAGIVTDLALDKDIIGVKRPQYFGPDIGAYEFAGAYTPSVVYVNTLANSGGDGTTWEKAYKTIQEGVNAAGANGTVLVATGTYNIATPISIKTGVKIYGGFRVGETNAADRAISVGGSPWDFMNETIINRGATIADANGSVLIVGGTDASDFNATFDGLTFTGGFSSVSSGGIRVDVKATITMTGCKVLNNKSTATGDGGGGGLIVGGDKKSAFINCLFSGNSATNGSGGGVNVSSSLGQDFTGCQFIGNTASKGGGIALVTTGTNISNSTFFNNTATATGIAGGGIWVKDNMGATVVNSIIAHNQLTHANGWGAGFVANEAQRSLKLINCTIVSNKAGSAENTRVAGQGAALTNCVLWNNKGGGTVVNAHQTYNCDFANCAYPTAGFVAGDNNLFIKPNSVIGFTPDATLGDWRLSSGSALLDKGTATNAPRTDILGAVRPIGGGYDIGAYEMDYSTPIIAQNGVIYLTQNGAGLKNGSSWENAVPAYRTSDAIKGLRAKDQLWIAKGSYTLSGNEVALDGDKMIYGGFEGTEKSLDNRIKVDRNGDKTINDWEFLNETILTKVNNSGRMMNLSSGAGLNGLTIKGFTHATDGAVQMKGSAVTKIVNCEFRELNGLNGGALLIGGGNHLVSACNFVANTSTATGGAIKVSGNAGIVTIEKSIFAGNKSTTRGGAISVAQNGTIIVNCLVANNEMGDAGAINTFDAENCKIINSTIVKNKISSGVWGAGVAAHTTNSQTQILNSVIWGNQNGGVNAWNVYKGTYKNCYIGPNGTADSHITDCILDVSNIGNNANFVDPSSGIGASIVGYESANWHIMDGSPVKGKGLVVGIEGTPNIDLDNQIRTGAVSIGAFEGRGVSNDIMTVSDFMKATQAGVSYVLKNDLDLDASYIPFAFNGFLIGSGYTIRINSPLTSGGLFTGIGTGASFESLSVEVNSPISNASGHTGVFAGLTTGLVTFKDITVTINNSVTSRDGDCGGLIGRATGTINAERVNVSLKTPLAGTPGLIEANGSGDLHAGGLIGRIDATRYLIKHSVVDVGGPNANGTKIAVNSTKSNRVGGLLGWSSGSTDIQNMIITGSTVRINENGALGQNTTKGAEASYVGGLIGGSSGITMNKSIAYVTTGGSILIHPDEIVADGTANYNGICGSGDVVGNNVFYLKGSADAPAKGVKTNNASNVYLIDSTDSLRIAGRMPFVKTNDNSSYANTFDYMMISIDQTHEQFVTYERAFLKAKIAGAHGINFVFDLDDKKTVTCAINLNLITSAGSLIYYVKAGATVPVGDLEAAETFDANTNPTPYGLSWTRPYAATHLQRALDKAGLNGGQVWVEGADVGEMQYRTRSQINKIVERGSIKPAFVIPAGVSLYGGFGLKEDSIDLRKKNSNGQFIYVSTLDAAFVAGDGAISDYDRVVYMEFGATLDGFLLKKGEVKNAQKGGAVYASAMSTLENLTVQENKAINAGAGIVLESGTILKNAIIEKNTLSPGGNVGYGYGAGVYVDGTDVTILDCKIRENTVETTGNANNGYGAGILVKQDSVLISKCDIRKNIIKTTTIGTVGIKGAGVCALGRMTLKDNMIIENEAGTKAMNGMNRGMGGGLYVISAKSIIENNKIYANYAGAKGGGIFAGRDDVSTGAEDILFYNNIVAHNHAQSEEGGGIHIIGTQKTRIINCSFLKNSTQQSLISNVRGGGNATEFINSIACQGFVGSSNTLANNNIASVTASNSVYYGKSNVTVVANSNCYEMQEIDNKNTNYLNFETPTTFNRSNAEMTAADIVNVEKASWMHREGRCFDRGRTIDDVPAVDIRGQKRPQGSAWDAGAYEYKPTFVIETFNVTPKTSTGEDIYLKAMLNVDNPMPVAIRIRLAWSGDGTQYMRIPPTEILIQPGAKEGSISAKMRPIDKKSAVKLTISTDETEATFAPGVPKEYTINLQPPVFTSDYTVKLVPSKSEFTEGESGSVYGELARPPGSSQPPGPIGISLKSLLAEDESSFEFGSNEEDKILWFNYGEEVSNHVTFKVISKLGEQFNGTKGRIVSFTKGNDYAQGHLSLETNMSLKITDISDDKLTKVNAVFKPIADAFTNETTRITITLDTKLNSTTPLNINLNFSPETLGIKTAVLSINPNQTEGSFDVVIPAVLPRTSFTVTATAQQSTWVNSLEPVTRTFKAGNSIIYVNAASVQGEDGLSFATGYRKIETALGKCNPTGVDGEEIRIAKGNYSLENPITITGKILLRGGYDPLKSDTELRVTGVYPWDMVDSTIITTQENKVAIYAKGYVLLDGLTLQKTGGVVLTDSVRMVNTKIIDNNVRTQTGAVLVDANAASVMIERCLIFNNTTTSVDAAAGAIKSLAPSYVNLTIRNSMIANNRAAKGAGATYGQITIENCLVVHNSLTVNDELAGAGAFNGGTRLIGSTVVKNKGGLGGSLGHVNIINSIFWKNLTNLGAAKQVETFNGCSFSAFEGLLPSKELDPAKYLIGLWESNEGTSGHENLLVPEFTRNSSFDGGYIENATIESLGNWRLKTNMSNMGTNRPNGTPVYAFDLDNTARIKKEIIDLGCYESDLSGLLTVRFDLTKSDTVYFGAAHSVPYEALFPMEGRIISLKYKSNNIEVDSPIDAGIYSIIPSDPAFTIVPQYVNNKDQFEIKPVDIEVTMLDQNIVIKTEENVISKLLFTTNIPLYERDIKTMTQKIVVPVLPPGFTVAKEGTWVISGRAIKGNYNVTKITNAILKVIKQFVDKNNVVWIYPDGEAAGPVLTYNGNERLCKVRFVGDLQATPSKNDYIINHSVTSPRTPGKYTASLTLKNGFTANSTFMVEYTIKPMEIELDMTTPTRKIYGDNDPLFYSYATTPKMHIGDALNVVNTTRDEGDNCRPEGYKFSTLNWSHACYTITRYEEGTLMIDPATLDVTPKNAELPYDQKPDPKLFPVTITGMKLKDSLDAIYGENIRPECMPDPSSKPVPNATVALYVNELTLSPRGEKGSNYKAIAHSGELKYKETSNQTLTFTLPNEIQYGSELTLVATSNQDSLFKMPITFTSTSENVKIVGDKLTALKIASNIEVVAHQAGNQALGIDPATASATLNIGKRVLSVEMPAQKIIYDGNEHGYDTSKIKIGNIINEDTVTWSYSSNVYIDPKEEPYDVTVTLTEGDELYSFADGENDYTEGALFIMKKPLNFTQTRSLPDSTYTAEMQYCDTTVFILEANQIITGDEIPTFVYYNGAKDQGQNSIRVEVDTANLKYTAGTATTFTGRTSGNGVFKAVFNILPAELKIDFADSIYSRKVGTDNPVLDTKAFKFAGFLGTDTITILPTYTTMATKESPIGEYNMTLDTTKVQFSTQKGNYRLQSPTENAKLAVVEKYISKADYIIEGNKQIFDGKTKAIKVTFKAGVFDDFNPEKDAKITYIRSGSIVNERSIPGQYIVNIEIVKPGISGDLKYETTLDIERAPLNLTYYNTTHIYDKTPKSVTYELVPSQPNDDFFKTYRTSVVFYTTYNNSSDSPSQVGEYDVRTWLAKNDPYYTLDASTKMIINRAESMPVGFGLPNIVTIKEPALGETVELPVTIKSLSGYPIRSGATVRIHVATSMEKGTYIVPDKVVFNDMDSAVFKISIKKGGNSTYSNQELLLSLASDEAEIRIDNPTQYRVIVENTDEPTPSSSARFMSTTVSAIEGSTVYGSIAADNNGGEATVKVSSKTDLYNVFVNNQLVDKKEFKVRLTGSTPTSLMIVLDPSYTANANVEHITFNLVSFTYSSGVKGTVNKNFNKFVVSVKNTNPLMGTVDLTDTIASNGHAIFDVVSFVKESYVSTPAYSLRLEKTQYVESKLTTQGALISIKNNKIVYDYSAIKDRIKNPKIGFNDTFTCIIDDGYGGKTEVNASVFISCNYTIGSNYEVRVTDFEKGAGNVFTKAPQISGQYIDPFAKVQAGRTPKIKKSSMKTQSEKGATFANIEITKKIKLVNTSALSKFRGGKYKEIVNDKEVIVAPSMFLDDAHNHTGVVVKSIGIQVIGKSNFTTQKEGENIGALIISHPAVQGIDYGRNIANNKSVVILNGNCFGKAPVGYLEYRRTDNKISTIKLKMLKSTKSNSVIIKGNSGKDYVAPTNDQIRLTSTEKSILIFELPIKLPSNRADKRLDILIDSGSGISGLKNIIMP